MMEDIECVFYRMCDKATFQQHIEKARIFSGLELRPNLAIWVRIRENNKVFLEELQEHILNGYKDCEWWLRGLCVDYVRRISRLNGDSGYNSQYYIDWLDNTRFICNNQSIVGWCDDYQRYVKNTDFPDKMFFEKLSPYIPKDSLDLLFGKLPEIKAKDLKRDWYENTKYKIAKNIGQREFFKLCSGVVPHRKGQKGWNESTFYKA